MSREANASGGLAPVGRLADLPPLEHRLVVELRLWRACAGEAGARGPDPRRSPLRAKGAEFLRLIQAHGRRPLQLGAVGANGVFGDEAVLARFVALAAEGARDDAILIATLLVRADVALGLGRVAEALGHLLMRAPDPALPVSVPSAALTR